MRHKSPSRAASYPSAGLDIDASEAAVEFIPMRRHENMIGPDRIDRSVRIE